MKYQCFLFLVLYLNLFFSSCADKKEFDNKEVTVLNIHLDGESSDNNSIRQSDFIDSVKCVKISGDAAIGYINSVKYCNGNYYLHDSQNHSIWIINEKGEVVNKICHYGRAKDEYLSLFKFDVNPRNGQVYIYDQQGAKMLYYSSDGTFLGSYKIDRDREVYRDFAVLPDGNILCTDLIYGGISQMNRGVWIADNNGRFIKYVYRPNEKIKRNLLSQNYFCRLDDGTIGMHTEVGNDTIYHYSNLTCKACFVIKPNLNYDKDWLNSDDLSSKMPDGFYTISLCVENQRFLLFTIAIYLEKNRPYGQTNVILYDKALQTIKTAKSENDIIFDKNYFGINTIGTSENKMFYILTPSQLPEKYKKMFPELEGCNQSVIQVAYLKQ